MKDGSIILFHNNAQHVLEYLPQVLENLKNNGYEVVKINDLIYHDNYHIDNNGIQISDGDQNTEQNSKDSDASSESSEPSESTSLSSEQSASEKSDVTDSGETIAEENKSSTEDENAASSEKGA